MAVLEKVRLALEEGNPVRSIDLSDDEKLMIREFHFITAKPVLYIANVAEDGLEDNPLVRVVEDIAQAEGAEVVVVSNKIESECGQNRSLKVYLGKKKGSGLSTHAPTYPRPPLCQF